MKARLSFPSVQCPKTITKSLHTYSYISGTTRCFVPKQIILFFYRTTKSTFTNYTKFISVLLFKSFCHNLQRCLSATGTALYIFQLHELYFSLTQVYEADFFLSYMNRAFLSAKWTALCFLLSEPYFSLCYMNLTISSATWTALFSLIQNMYLSLLHEPYFSLCYMKLI